MSVGLPGSGIGGIFYLLSALWMPCAGAWRAVRGQPVRLRMVAKQTLLALGMIAALFATGWAIEQLIVLSAWTPFGPKGPLAGTTALPHILRATTFAWSFGTLASVLLTVQILRLYFNGRTGKGHGARGNAQGSVALCPVPPAPSLPKKVA